MKVNQHVLRILFLLGLWLGLGLQAYAQKDTVTYVYTDPQGTPLAEADAQGNIIARYDYTPYGNAVASLGSPPNGPGYTGHVNDPETGLVYMQQRYYQPNGRFLSPDPVGPTAGNIYSFNRYDYTNNNPINHTDPDGRCSDADGSCGRMVAAQGAYAAAHPNEPLSPIAKVGLGAMLTASGAGAVVEVVEGAAVLDKVLSEAPKESTITRYMGPGEAQAATQKGAIPNVEVDGIPRPTHATTDTPISSAAAAQAKYELPTPPTHSATVPANRVSDLGPTPDGRSITSGGGSQSATNQPIPVKPDEIKPLTN